MRPSIICAALTLAALTQLPCPALQAVTYHVDVNLGADENQGTAPGAGHALASLQAAAEKVAPGDTISLADGVYYGPIELKIAGTAEAPILIKAANRKKGAVTLTNAVKGIRERKSQWTEVDGTPGLYRIPLDRQTCRVLYSGVDLQPYHSLEALKSFTTADKNPGPRHGYFYDETEGQLYVILHASGKYGSTNPAEHLVAVGPRTGTGSAGTQYDGPSYYNLGLTAGGPIHVILEGLTFETPGFTGIMVDGSDVSVRDSWFEGCRSAISGKRESEDPTKTANRVTLEFCEYHNYPAFDDVLEIMELKKAGKVTIAPEKFPAFWWSRKGGGAGAKLTYEVGICNNVGSGWIVRNNHIHDAFEAFATWGVRWSRNLEIANNRMERLVDNAIETEDHTSGMTIHGNLIVNAVEPFSWQPLGGEPWPGPVYIYNNLVINEYKLNLLISEVLDWSPGWFKAGASKDNWEAPWNSHMKGVSMDSVASPGDGVVVFNNTVYYPAGNFLTRVQPAARKFENFHFLNNVSVAGNFSRQKGSFAENMRFTQNIWYTYPPARDEEPSNGEKFAGQGGTVLNALPEALASQEELADIIRTLCETDLWKEHTGVSVPNAVAAYPEAATISKVGVFLKDGKWQMPQAGPRP